MDGAMAEVLLSLDVVQCPIAVDERADVARVGADRCIAAFERPGSGAVGERLVLNRADVSAAPAHHEAAIPIVGQQQLEVDLLFYDARDFAVWGAGVHLFDRCDPRVLEHQRGEVGACLVGIRLAGHKYEGTCHDSCGHPTDRAHIPSGLLVHDRWSNVVVEVYRLSGARGSSPPGLCRT